MRNAGHSGRTIAAAVSSPVIAPRFPTTRYQGSKQRHLGFLRRALERIPAGAALDLFAGTGAVSYLLKQLGHAVHFNDALLANQASGVALIENSGTQVALPRADALFRKVKGRRYDDVIARSFEGVFYLPEENRALDVAAQNLAATEDRIERALLFHALAQACLMKRPFNLFHRANLSLRTREVTRSFGNKATWERPFAELTRAALAAANAAVFDSGKTHRATALDALSCPIEADLVYLDPPYVRADGAAFGYLDGYHFLDGLLDYSRWAAAIDHTRRHLPLSRPGSPFEHARTAPEALESVLERANGARWVVLSYRTDGLPSPSRLRAVLEQLGRRVTVLEQATTYTLSRRRSAELLFVAERRKR